jgi:hypothetical protein
MVAFLLVGGIFLLFQYIDFDRPDDNAYIVSSEYKSAPIISSETGQTVGQAYPGFAISLTDVKNDKAYFDLKIDNSSQSLYILIEYMEKACVNMQNSYMFLSLDAIYVNADVNIIMANNDAQYAIAKFVNSIGPITPIFIYNDGYAFIIGMNWAYVANNDIVLIKSPVIIPG